MHTILLFIAFGICLFFQNMAFTWTSRSRNSGDPNYHRYAAWCSNGVYFLCNLPLTVLIIKFQHDWKMLLLAGIVYTVCTAEGSVLMMKILLKKEKGKHMVGAR